MDGLSREGVEQARATMVPRWGPPDVEGRAQLEVLALARSAHHSDRTARARRHNVDRRGAALVRTHARQCPSRRHDPLSAAELRGGIGVHDAARAHPRPRTEGRSTGTGIRKKMNNALNANTFTVSQRIERAAGPELYATPDVHQDPQGWASLSMADFPLFEAVA